MLYPEMPGEVVASQDKVTVCVGAAVPVRVNPAVVIAGEASLVTVKVALRDPAVVGLNVIVYGRLCPAAIVTGSEILPRLNAEFVVLAAVMVTLAPVTVHFPGGRAAGADNHATYVRKSPGTRRADRGTWFRSLSRGLLRLASDALDVIMTLPLTVPAADGAKLILSAVLCPADRVKGVFTPDIVKAVPLTLT